MHLSYDKGTSLQVITDMHCLISLVSTGIYSLPLFPACSYKPSVVEMSISHNENPSGGMTEENQGRWDR